MVAQLLELGAELLLLRRHHRDRRGCFGARARFGGRRAPRSGAAPRTLRFFVPRRATAPSAPSRPWSSRRPGRPPGRASPACRSRRSSGTSFRSRACGRRPARSGSCRSSAPRADGPAPPSARPPRSAGRAAATAPWRAPRPPRPDRSRPSPRRARCRLRRGCGPTGRRPANGRRSRGRSRACRPAPRRARSSRSRWRGRGSARASAPRRSAW